MPFAVEQFHGQVLRLGATAMARLGLLSIEAADKATLLLPTLESAIGHTRKMEEIALGPTCITGPFTPHISMPPRINSPYRL